jgi:hypothetical protein
MAKLSISRAWEEAKAIFAHDGGLMASVALALIVLPSIVLAVVGAPVDPQSSLLSKVVYVAVILLGLVTQVALNRLAIGPSVTVREAIGVGLVRLLPVALLVVLVIIGLALITVLLLVVLGGAAQLQSGGRPPASVLAILAIITALVFAIFQLIFPIAAVETGNPLRLAARSWQLARRHYARLLAFILIVFVGFGLAVAAIEFGLASVIVVALGQPNPGSMSALLLGLVAGTLQAAFTVVTAVMLSRIYLQLAGGDAHASVPRSGI